MENVVWLQSVDWIQAKFSTQCTHLATQLSRITTATIGQTIIGSETLKFLDRFSEKILRYQDSWNFFPIGTELCACGEMDRQTDLTQILVAYSRFLRKRLQGRAINLSLTDSQTVAESENLVTNKISFTSPRCCNASKHISYCAINHQSWCTSGLNRSSETRGDQIRTL